MKRKLFNTHFVQSVIVFQQSLDSPSVYFFQFPLSPHQFELGKKARRQTTDGRKLQSFKGSNRERRGERKRGNLYMFFRKARGRERREKREEKKLGNALERCVLAARTS